MKFISLLLIFTILTYGMASLLKPKKPLSEDTPYIGPSPAQQRDSCGINAYPWKPTLKTDLVWEGPFWTKTDDDYWLQFFRVHKKGAESSKNFEHPIIWGTPMNTDFNIWFLFDDRTLISPENYKQKSVLSQMIENGYDNFVVNWRGTMYSLGHDDPNITQEKYWDFSWQEMASFDLPAFYKGVSRVKWGDANYNQVDDKTYMQRKVTYWSSSQGSTIGWAAQNDKAHMKGTKTPLAVWTRDRTKRYISMDPATYFQNTMSGALDMWKNSLRPLIKAIEGPHLLHNGCARGNLFDWRDILNQTCDKMNFCPLQDLGLLKNPDPNSDGFGQNIPITGIGLKTVDHYVQLMAAGDQVFRKWDFGSAEENQAHYGQDTPTEYTYEGYDVPTLIISGDSDFIATPHNTDHLIAEVRKAYSKGRKNPDSLQCYQLAGAGHCWSIFTPVPEYRKLLNDFMNDDWSAATKCPE